MDIQLIIKAGAGVVAAVCTLLTVTHNLSSDTAVWINGFCATLIGLFGANDHNTAK